MVRRSRLPRDLGEIRRDTCLIKKDLKFPDFPSSNFKLTRHNAPKLTASSDRKVSFQAILVSKPLLLQYQLALESSFSIQRFSGWYGLSYVYTSIAPDG